LLGRRALDGRIAQPSIAALIQNITNIESGQTKSAYKLAREQGLSTTDARHRPATSAYIAITEFIADYTATTVATAVA
jgi:hypothetical protein